MKDGKVLGANVKINDYQKVIDYIDLYNNKTGSNDSVSKFVWDAIKHYVNYLRNSKGIK